MSLTGKVYTVRRAYSHGLFTIRVCDKPSIVAFQSKRNASSLVALEKMMANGQPQQPLCIDFVSLQSLKRRCSMNALTLTVYDEEGDYTIFDEINSSMDDMQFHLEHVIKYFDP